ncbi:hypothetical protein TNCT6_37830 [Streptomyces sp. 6-11-2]|nr:hypothetical protein TNCT6_37830 [Streptomyces sp. 6-11-2]
MVTPPAGGDHNWLEWSLDGVTWTKVTTSGSSANKAISIAPPKDGTHTLQVRAVDKAYDKLGRQIAYTDADGGRTTTEYDLLDRPVKSTDTVPSTGHPLTHREQGSRSGEDRAGRQCQERHERVPYSLRIPRVRDLREAFQQIRKIAPGHFRMRSELFKAGIRDDASAGTGSPRSQSVENSMIADVRACCVPNPAQHDEASAIGRQPTTPKS